MIVIFCFVFVLSIFRMQKNTALRHHDFITEAPLGGHGHADAGGYTLPQWACGHLHAARLAELGVARAARPTCNESRFRQVMADLW